MIKFNNQVPSVYPSASRDFQYISWLVDIVLNSVKHNTDSLYTLPTAVGNTKLTELLAMTLGFKVKRNYDNKQLAALVGVLPSILKYKGTERAITVAAEALIKASGAGGDFSCKAEGAQLIIVFPKELVDTTLFMDLLEYILPAGMTCRIIRETQTKRYLEDILVGYKDTMRFGQYKDLVWDNTNLSTGLSGLFDTDKPTTDVTANFILSAESDEFVLNSGLLSNTVIPILATNTPGISTDQPIYPNMVDCDGKILVSADELILFGREDPDKPADVRPYTNMVDHDGKVLVSSDYKVLLGNEQQ